MPGAFLIADDTKVGGEKRLIRMLNAYNRLYSFVDVCKRILKCPLRKKNYAWNATLHSEVV